MSYEKWIDSVDGCRGLSLEQAYKAGQLDTDVTVGEVYTFECGERTMLEKLRMKWMASCLKYKDSPEDAGIHFAKCLDQLACETEGSDKPKTCEWKHYSGNWCNTECGKQEYLAPKDRFCCRCGGEIVEVDDG